MGAASCQVAPALEVFVNSTRIPRPMEAAIAAVQDYRELTLADLAVAVLIASHMWNRAGEEADTCWISFKTLAKEGHTSVDSIRRSVRRLASAGIFGVKWRGQAKGKYRNSTVFTLRRPRADQDGAAAERPPQVAATEASKLPPSTVADHDGAAERRSQVATPEASKLLGTKVASCHPKYVPGSSKYVRCRLLRRFAPQSAAAAPRTCRRLTLQRTTYRSDVRIPHQRRLRHHQYRYWLTRRRCSLKSSRISTPASKPATARGAAAQHNYAPERTDRQ